MRIKKSLAEYTADALGEQIVVQKKYKTGDQPPNEIELAREFGVSRATLREAIRVLAVQGIGGNRDCLPKDGEKTYYISFREI